MRPRVLLLSLALTASACITRTYTHAVVVKAGSSDDERTQIAQAFATPDRLERLRAQLKERFPTVTDAQLQRLTLRWNRTTLKLLSGGESTTTVSVIIQIQHDADFDPKPLIGAATELIESELNSKA